MIGGRGPGAEAGMLSGLAEAAGEAGLVEALASFGRRCWGWA